MSKGPSNPGHAPSNEPLGMKIRRNRRRLGLTLDEVAGRASISKPYLSLIETGRIPNPPSDEKLRRLEQALGFAAGELLTQAHLHRTPKDVRAVLQQLMSAEGQGAPKKEGQGRAAVANTSAQGDLDADSLSGVLKELMNRTAGLEPLASNVVPVINRISAGYPRDFSDLQYPSRVADEFLSCPGIADPEAFAARVDGDSMTPHYNEGDLVVFAPAQAAREGDDCFVRFADGRTTFRRVFFERGENNHPLLRLQPRNERHRPQTVPAEQVAGLYRAVFRYHAVNG